MYSFFVSDCKRDNFRSIFPMAEQPPVRQGLLIIKAPRSYSDAPPSVRTLLDERSALGSDLFLTAHNTRKRLTTMLSAGFEPAIPASKRPQIHVLDREDTGICISGM